MTPRDKFVELVKLHVTLNGTTPETAVGIVARAMSAPDWAPRIEDVRDEGGWSALVKNFVEWNYRTAGYDTPAWYYRAAGRSPDPDTGG